MCTLKGCCQCGAICGATPFAEEIGPCINFCCAALCLAGSIASCINPLDVGLCCTIEVAKLTAGLSGCGSALCCCAFVYKVSMKEEVSSSGSVVTSQPT